MECRRSASCRVHSRKPVNRLSDRSRRSLVVYAKPTQRSPSRTLLNINGTFIQIGSPNVSRHRFQQSSPCLTMKYLRPVCDMLLPKDLFCPTHRNMISSTAPSHPRGDLRGSSPQITSAGRWARIVSTALAKRAISFGVSLTGTSSKADTSSSSRSTQLFWRFGGNSTYASGSARTA